MSSGSPRLLVLFTFASAVVVGLIIALATGYWWVLIIAVAVHLATTGVVTRGIFKRIEQGDKPSPTEEARIEDERAGRAAG